MKTINKLTLAVLIASALIAGDHNSTRAAAGGPLKGNNVIDTTGRIEKRDLVITRNLRCPDRAGMESVDRSRVRHALVGPNRLYLAFLQNRFP